MQILRLVTKGKRPERLEHPRMEDTIWDLIHNCMETIPSQRPTMESIMMKLTSFKLFELSTAYTELPPTASPSLPVIPSSFSATPLSSPATATLLSGVVYSLLARLNEVMSVLLCINAMRLMAASQ
jgi:hypothetical protein